MYLYFELPSKRACSLRFSSFFFQHTRKFSACLLIEFIKVVLPARLFCSTCSGLFPPLLDYYKSSLLVYFGLLVHKIFKKMPACSFIPVCSFITKNKNNESTLIMNGPLDYLNKKTYFCDMFENSCFPYYLPGNI